MYLCEEEDEGGRAPDLVQDVLQALGLDGQQGPQRGGLQRGALHLLGAEGPLGDHRLGLSLQPDHRLVDGVQPGTAGGVDHRQALLYKTHTHTHTHTHTQ